MARVLVVGGAGRAAELVASGHVVETADGVDPERLATLTPRLDGVTFAGMSMRFCGVPTSVYELTGFVGARPVFGAENFLSPISWP